MQYSGQVFTFFKLAVKVLVSLKDSLDARRITSSETRNVLFKLLARILVFKAEAYLLDLFNSNQTSIILVKDQLEALKSLIAALTIMPRKLIFTDLGNIQTDEKLILMN